MKTVSYESAEAFLDVAREGLAAEEAQSGLLIAFSQVEGTRRWAVLEGDACAIAAVRTAPRHEESGPGRKLILGPGRCAAAAWLGRELAHELPEIPGVVGPVEVAGAFAEAFASERGTTVVDGVQMRVHELREVAELASPRGCIRAATLGDETSIRGWGAAFMRDVDHDDPGDGDHMLRAVVEQGRLRVWELDGVPVSMAAWSRRTWNGVALNWVYTPPAHRGRGYATALVAALSREMLVDGCGFCCLFTDLANPTSNAIYARIGYQPVADWADFWFGKRPG